MIRTSKFLPGISAGRYPWLVVALLWVVAFLNYLDRILITSMRDPIVHEFAISDAKYGLLTSVFLWTYGVLSPFGGYFADRYSRKKVIVFSVLVWSAVTLWTGAAATYEELLVSRMVMGISEACYIPAALAMITDYHRGKTRSLATGLHMSGLYAGLAVGGIGGYIAVSYGWRFGFHVFGIFGIVYSLFLLWLLRDCPRADMPQVSEGQEPKDNTTQNAGRVQIIEAFKSLLAMRSFYVLMLFFGAFGVVNWLVYGWLPTFLQTHFRLDLGLAGISATGYIQLGSFIGVILGGILADRWARKTPRGRINVIILGFTVGAPFLFLMASTSVFYLAIIAMAIFGLARGFTDANLMPVLRQIADERYIATGYGVLNFLGTVIGGLMVYVGGALKDARISLSLIYQASAILILIAAWLLFSLKIKNKS